MTFCMSKMKVELPGFKGYSESNLSSAVISSAAMARSLSKSPWKKKIINLWSQQNCFLLHILLHLHWKVPSKAYLIAPLTSQGMYSMVWGNHSLTQRSCYNIGVPSTCSQSLRLILCSSPWLLSVSSIFSTSMLSVFLGYSHRRSTHRHVCHFK